MSLAKPGPGSFLTLEPSRRLRVIAIAAALLAAANTRTLWSLSNAFTSAFKELDPVPRFKATASLGGFLAPRP